MRKFIWTFILVGVAGLIAYGSRNYPGTAQFVLLGFQLTMNIYLFAFLCVVLCLAGVLLWRFYRALVNLPVRFGEWRTNRREHRALAAVKTATIALQEGRWAHAEKAAKIASKKSDSLGIAALLGAASARAQNKNLAEKEWLAHLDIDADFHDAKVLQMAEIALMQNDSALALTTLVQASPTVRKHSGRFKEIEIGAHAHAGHWHEVLQIVKDPKWLASIATKNRWHAQAVIAICSQGGGSVAYLQAMYKDMPTDVRSDEDVMAAYAQVLIKNSQGHLARLAIEEAQKRLWRPSLLKFYADAFDESGASGQLKMIEVWLALHPTEPKLLNCAGQLCLKSKLWGRAKGYFDGSLALTASVAAHFGLAQTYRAMNDVPSAQEQERLAAAMAASAA
jgi:HemY protein